MPPTPMIAKHRATTATRQWRLSVALRAPLPFGSARGPARALAVRQALRETAHAFLRGLGCRRGLPLHPHAMARSARLQANADGVGAARRVDDIVVDRGRRLVGER